MRLCDFPGCDRFPHVTGPHARWDSELGKQMPLAEQRTRAQILAESRDRMRRKKAELIAAENFPSGHWPQGDADMIRASLTAAALQALTETENAR